MTPTAMLLEPLLPRRVDPLHPVPARPVVARRRRAAGLVLGELGMLIAVVGDAPPPEIIPTSGSSAGSSSAAGIGIAISATDPDDEDARANRALALVRRPRDGARRRRGVHARGRARSRSSRWARSGFETFLGFLTFTGSIMAFGKLQGFITGAPVTWKGQNFINIGLFFGVARGASAILVVRPRACSRSSS